MQQLSHEKFRLSELDKLLKNLSVYIMRNFNANKLVNSFIGVASGMMGK